MKTVVLDAKKMGGKESAHEYIKEILDLPDYYGANLDALHDCLSEIAGLRLVIIHSNEAGTYFNRMKAVLEDSAEVIYLG